MSAPREECRVAVFRSFRRPEQDANGPGAVSPRRHHDRRIAGVFEFPRLDRGIRARLQEGLEDFEAPMPQRGHEGSFVVGGVEAVHVRALGEETPNQREVTCLDRVVQPIREIRFRARLPKHGDDLLRARSLRDGERADSELVEVVDVGATLDEKPHRRRLVLGGHEERGLSFPVGEIGVGAFRQQGPHDLDPVRGAENERGLAVRVFQVRVGSGGEKLCDHSRVSADRREHERG